MNIEVANITPEQLTPERVEEFAAAVITLLELPVSALGIIFVDDPFLCRLHEQYLDDPAPTDIMTFDLSEPDSEVIEAELYISMERARDQAKSFSVRLEEEIARLVIHGLLHLQGLDDREAEERRRMRSEENRILRQFQGRLNFGL